MRKKELRRYIRLNGRCKICKLLKQDAELFDDLHDRLLTRKQSQAVVLNWLNGRVEIKNMGRPKEDQIKLFQKQNFTAHMKKHVDDNGKVLREVQPPPLIVEHSTFTEEEKASAYVDVDLDEFIRAEQAAKLLSESMEAYSKKIRKTLDNDGVPSRLDLEAIQKMLVSVLDSQQTIAKVRNSKQVAGEAIKYAVELLIIAFLDKLIEATNEQQAILTQQMEGSSLPVELTNMLRGRVGDGIKSAVVDIVEKVTVKYGIK